MLHMYEMRIKEERGPKRKLILINFRKYKSIRMKFEEQTFPVELSS